MPALTASSTPNASTGKAPASVKMQLPKKMRVVRRRGRGPAAGGLDSDEEIEREVGSDSDSDAQSSLVSDESDHDDAEPRITTPSTTQSPPPHEADELKPGQDVAGPFQLPSTDWSDMVAVEDMTGESSLPVIDFADMHQPSVDEAERPLSDNASGAPAPTSTSDDFIENNDTLAPHHNASSSSAIPPRRPYAQNARLAYQEKLEKDPSFIPRIGEFWGHDDRLFDKDTRPLSNWWRGRGRGGVPNRGRGRGGWGGYGRPPPGFGPDTDRNNMEVESAEVPPVDRAWTHDGFEEMRRRDEQRKPGLRGSVRGGRGRGGSFRGGSFTLPFQPSQAGSVTNVPPSNEPSAPAPSGAPTIAPPRSNLASTSAPPPAGCPATAPAVPKKTTHSLLAPPLAPFPRVWYSMKPERLWTKQHEGFLYFDFALKPRPGLGPGLRVHLPGGASHVIRVPSHVLRPQPINVGSSVHQALASMTFIVHLPTTIEKPSVLPKKQAVDDAAVLATEASTGRPTSVEPPAYVTEPLLAEPAAVNPTTSLPAINVHLPRQQQQQPKLTVETTFSQDPAYPAPLSEDVAQAATLTFQSSAPIFNPSTQGPSAYPPYGVPYGYPPHLPPGVGIGPNGVPFEFATGRLVFVPGLGPQSVPGRFTPPVGMHVPPGPGPMPFVPGHMHHQSSMSMTGAPSPDFLAPHPRPSPMATFIDPATGHPLFTPARQSSRIEIRAPSDTGSFSSPAQPFVAGASVSPAGQMEQLPHQTNMPVSMLPPGQPMFAPYPQPQFFYPEQHYGYQSFMPHHASHPGYEMYSGPEHIPPPGTVYYQ
jgi:hypothetical protein